MRGISLTRCVAVALFAGALACARNQETGTAAVAEDTTAAADTTGQAQNPPGYRGMERDTAMVPSQQQQPVDTFLQQQGTNPKADTAGYGAERVDTTGAGQRADTAAVTPTDTAGYQQQGQAGQTDSVRLPHDSTRMHTDSAGVNKPDGQKKDTTGY